MRPRKGQTVREIEERDGELSDCVVDLAQRIELAEGVGGDVAFSQETDSLGGEADDSSDPIELITENGFSIVRPWESGNAPKPTGGKYRFGVSDGFIEREVTVEVSHDVVTEVSLRTRGRIQLSNSFWTCCAERHLANYVSEHADFPDNDELVLDELDGEDALLAIRWDRSDE
jgi:hypothetical protein